MSVVVFVFLSWNVLMYYFLISKNPAKNDNTVLVGDQLKWLQNDIEKQLKDNENLLEDLRKIKEETVKKDKDLRIYRRKIKFNVQNLKSSEITMLNPPPKKWLRHHIKMII